MERDGENKNSQHDGDKTGLEGLSVRARAREPARAGLPMAQVVNFESLLSVGNAGREEGPWRDAAIAACGSQAVASTQRNVM